MGIDDDVAVKPGLYYMALPDGYGRFVVTDTSHKSDASNIDVAAKKFAEHCEDGETFAIFWRSMYSSNIGCRLFKSVNNPVAEAISF